MGTWKKIVEDLERRWGKNDKEYQRKLYEGRANASVSDKDFDPSYVDQAWQFPLEGEIEEAVGDVDWLDPGGYIVLSTDITPQTASIDTIKNSVVRLMRRKAESLRAKGISLAQRAVRNKRIEKAVKKVSKEEGQDFGFSIGNMFRGHYYDQKQDTLFSEKSLSVEIRGVDSKTLKTIALELGKAFDQWQVLVYDSSVNRPYLLTTK